MKLSCRLNSNDLRNMADEIRQYSTSLEYKLAVFTSRLAEKGIAVASQTVGSFGKYIAFYRESVNDGISVVAQEVSQITASWLKYGKQVDALVSPLLMAEFGSGPHAIIWEGLNGTISHLSNGKDVGRGTFPYQTHADEDSWWYMDLDGEWHQTRGVTPTRPMHNALIEMITQINSTAREVFGNGSN